MLVASAIATPNSVLSEEAFKGLQGRSLGASKSESEDEDVFEDDEDQFEEEDDDEEFAIENSPAADGDELAIASLGLPPQLVDSLHKRGITRLFPIQVSRFKLPLRFSLFQGRPIDPSF